MRNGNIAFYNEATSKLFALKKDFSESDSILKKMVLIDWLLFTKELWKPEKNNTKNILTYQNNQKIISYSSTLLVKNDLIIMIFHDVTHIKRLDTIRQEFVANISHELKTPLTSIKGFAESLIDWALYDPNKNEKFLKKYIIMLKNYVLWFKIFYH